MIPPPKISILMPVRNEERYLSAALNSIFSQTFTPWELVAIDDSSSDDTPAILAGAARRDPRVRVTRCKGGGLVNALNEGLSLCRAPLIARMDGDDICHPRRFELQSAYLDDNPDIGLAACSFHHFPRTGLKQGMLAYERWQNSLCTHDLIIHDLFVESPFVHPSILTRRDLMERLGGYCSSGWPEDYDLWMRMSQSGVRFGRLPQILFFWRDHPERATRTMTDYSTQAFRMCKAHYLLNSFLKGRSRVIIAGAGLEGRAWQRLLSSEGIKVTCWLDVDPKKVGSSLHGAPIIRPEELPRNPDKMLVAIGVRGAREEFRILSKSLGLREGLDFISVA